MRCSERSGRHRPCFAQTHRAGAALSSAVAELGVIRPHATSPVKSRRLLVAVGIVLLLPAGFALRHVWRERYYHLTASGALGCGVANIQVSSGGSVYTVRTGLDTPRLLGRPLDADDLVARFEQRRASIRPGPETWREHHYTRDEYELMLAANVLIQVKHPKALEILVGLLDDPLFVERADDWLVKLGDIRACSYLLESWKKRPEYPFVYVNAFRKLPYKPAVPLLIDVFYIHMGDYDAEAVFSTIEIITGESLQRFRGRRLQDKQSVKALKADLHKWWSAHPPA